MQNKLQELTDKLYNEGLSKGKQEGEELVAKARKEAEQIVAKAKEQAEQIVAQAEQKAAELGTKTERDIKHEIPRRIFAQPSRQHKQIIKIKFIATYGNAAQSIKWHLFHLVP